MGRWSRKVAPLFIDWIDAPRGASWIDIGCGTGVPTAALLERCEPSGIVGIDSSAGFLEAARHQVGDPRVSFNWAMPRPFRRTAVNSTWPSPGSC